MNKRLGFFNRACQFGRVRRFSAILLIGVVVFSPLQETLAAEEEKEKLSTAYAALQAGELQKAMKIVNAELKKNPRFALALEMKGRIFLARRQPEAAAEYFFRAFESDPKLDSVHFHLGEIAFSRRQWPVAIRYYARYFKVAKDPRDAALKVIYCQVAMKQLAAAGQIAANLNPTDPSHPAYYFARAAIDRASGNLEKAQSNLQQAQTHYGIPTYNRFLPDYLWVFKPMKKKKPKRRQERGNA